MPMSLGKGSAGTYPVEDMLGDLSPSVTEELDRIEEFTEYERKAQLETCSNEISPSTLAQNDEVPVSLEL